MTTDKIKEKIYQIEGQLKLLKAAVLSRQIAQKRKAKKSGKSKIAELVENDLKRMQQRKQSHK